MPLVKRRAVFQEGLDLDKIEHLCIERKFAVFNELHHRDRRDGLGNAGDPEEGIGVDGGAPISIRESVAFRQDQSFVFHHG